MNISTRLTFKGDDRDSRLRLIRSDNGDLCLRPDNGREDIPLVLDGLSVVDVDYSLFEESESVVKEVMAGLIESLVELESSGIELTDDDEEDDMTVKTPAKYSPRDIYVENKPFSIHQLMFLIQNGDLEMSPNFQRNFVWNRKRQSLLIESILLGLPIPSIYLSQYDDGRLTVVDGLQRISTIQKFLDNKLRLTDLEYLTECNDKTFEQIKEVLPPLQIRQFSQAQIGCYVIDYRSPDRLKFDLFKRLNTGAKPLNRSEIRNCLSRKHVQEALREMWESEEFITATAGSVNNARMQAADLVTRYLFFKGQYAVENPIGSYTGNIESSLDEYTEVLNRRKDFSEDIAAFKEAMRSARYLFGDDAFRKESKSKNRRLAINQLLFVVLSVLLSQVSSADVEGRYEAGALSSELYRLIETDKELRKALAGGTNARWNISVTFRIIRNKLLSKLY